MIRFRLAECIADKEFRERRQIQLLEVAADSGVGRMTLSKLLNHHGASIRTEYLDRLCRYFDCRVEDLMEYVPDTESSKPVPVQRAANTKHAQARRKRGKH
ncbi:MAG: helix-turn-helix domain-containing protein [Rhodanobacteraceae bacterium]